MSDIEKVITTALNEEGYLEKKNNLIDKLSTLVIY